MNLRPRDYLAIACVTALGTLLASLFFGGLAIICIALLTHGFDDLSYRQPERFLAQLGTAIALLASAGSGVAIARAAIANKRRRLRQAARLCPSCAYDRRATPDRCPECGEPTAPAGVQPSP